MIKQKRGGIGLWILIIIILVAVGIGAYFLLTSGSDGGILSGGNSIPSPPSLPS
jgi:hypothetical protein|tara:strand:+ start:815 stop:976 length:162 start_codon:yes stop_codon:yes gene_type:complete